MASQGVLGLFGGGAGASPRNRLLSELLDGQGLAEANSLLDMVREGGAGAGGALAGEGGRVVDTSGNELGFKGAFGGILGNETLGDIVGGAVPGGEFSGMVGRGLRALAGGPFGVVGMEEVGIGHPQWGRKMALIAEAQRRNANHARAQRARDAIAAGTRSSPRNTSPGRRGARDRGNMDIGGPGADSGIDPGTGRDRNL